jgi:hypothetical protein
MLCATETVGAFSCCSTLCLYTDVVTERHFESASPVRASSKRSKHDCNTSMEDGIERTNCALPDRTLTADSTECNIQRTVGGKSPTLLVAANIS